MVAEFGTVTGLVIRTRSDGCLRGMVTAEVASQARRWARP
jgi:hypothetical protein